MNARRHGRERRGWHGGCGLGFTLVELLVVIAVITILAAMMMPSLLRGMSQATTTDCIVHVRQIATASFNYSKDYFMILITGGDGTGEHAEGWVWPRASGGGETYAPVATFPYWYQVLTTVERMQADIFTCPAKQGCAVGYGYHINAPYGVSGLYLVDNKAIHKKEWTWTTGDYDPNNMDNVNVSYMPVDNHGEASPIKTLWYRQCAPFGSIASPSSQIGFCDTGKIINDTALTTDPTKWQEDTTSNAKGYVRFPLSDTYTSEDAYKGTGTGPGKSWRPIGRHNGKVVCANLDNSAQAVSIRDVVGSAWFQPDCLYDNISPDTPGIKKRWD